LGEEHFEYALKHRLRGEGIETLRRAREAGQRVVLFGESLEHVLRPLARHLDVDEFIANRMEFRGGVATGRLLEPVIHPRGPLSWVASSRADGRVAEHRLLAELGLNDPTQLQTAIEAVNRTIEPVPQAVVAFDSAPRVAELSVRRALAGK